MEDQGRVLNIVNEERSQAGEGYLPARGATDFAPRLGPAWAISALAMIVKAITAEADVSRGCIMSRGGIRSRDLKWGIDTEVGM
jgi:hypothetical protein